MIKRQILDTTLRDGSYVNEFCFSQQDVRNIVSSLEDAGIEYIEIGHGVGLGAARKGYKAAIHTDEEYIDTAREALTKSKFGAFSIVGMTELSDIKMAAEHGMDFIRIGADIHDTKLFPKYIDTAKSHGLYVMCNIMKSYILSPKEFAEIAKEVKSYGADTVYLVDSAGGMFPSDIKNYYQAVKDLAEINMGFHGHDNLGLAIANCLQAYECGFAFIDASLQGLGRSAGNASTEILVGALLKQNHTEINVDLFKIIDAGQKYVKEITENIKRELDIISGYSDFHSSYMPIIHKYAAKYSIDPRKLIIELTKVNKMSAPVELVDSIAATISKSDISTSRFEMHKYIGLEQK